MLFDALAESYDDLIEIDQYGDISNNQMGQIDKKELMIDCPH